MRYFCFFDHEPDVSRYELAVTDRARDRKFSMTFAIARVEQENAHCDLRKVGHDRMLVRLWTAIKAASPGTYLDAKRLGWLPEEVTRYDHG